MAYRDILVHLDGGGACQERTRAAILLAQLYEAHVVGLCPLVQPVLPAYLQAYVSDEVLQQQSEAARDVAQSVKDQFETAVLSRGLAGECRAEGCLEPDVARLLSSHARSADVVVLSQVRDDEIPLGGRRVPEDVALGSGRPVLLVPYIGLGDSIGRRVLVAWDGSREAARAVNDALPLLVDADSVVIALVQHGREIAGGTEMPGANIAAHLAHHGCKVEVDVTRNAGIGIGDTILSRCADISADLLVMGAYGHTRFREMVLGGVTRHILKHMTVPTLLSH